MNPFSRIFGNNTTNPSDVFQKGAAPFNSENDIDLDRQANGNYEMTPALEQELLQIKNAFNNVHDGAARVLFLQWLVKQSESRKNLTELLKSVNTSTPGAFVGADRF